MDGIQPEDAAYMGRMRERKDRRMNQLPSDPNPALSIICSCSNDVPYHIPAYIDAFVYTGLFDNDLLPLYHILVPSTKPFAFGSQNPFPE